MENKIHVGPGLVWQVAPDRMEQVYPDSIKLGFKPSPLDVAHASGWKVGEDDVRVIGHGEMPELGQRVVVGKWLVMRTGDYAGIVPQEALDRVQILLDEGVTIKGLLVADDLRHHRPSPLQRARDKVVNRLKEIDWRKPVTEAGRSMKAAGSVIGSAVARSMKAARSVVSTAVVTGEAKVKKKVQEVDWDEVKAVTVKGAKAVGVAVACATAVVAVAAVALPLIAVATLPVAALTFDPLLIIVDDESRWWVIAEWWD